MYNQYDGEDHSKLTDVALKGDNATFADLAYDHWLQLCSIYPKGADCHHETAPTIDFAQTSLKE